MLLDLLLPPRCGACRRIGSWLCAECRLRIRRLQEPLCPRCGVELDAPRDRCACRGRLVALTTLRSAVSYEGPAERALHRFKYQGWRRLARPLAGLMAERLAVEGVAGGLVVAVPLHPQRLRQRGFNQAELLAREIRRHFGLGLPRGDLRRIRPTPPQVGHDRRWRLQNVKGAFEWVGPPLDGAPILVIDDVATTGATLDACASALRAAASGPVTGVSVARVNV